MYHPHVCYGPTAAQVNATFPWIKPATVVNLDRNSADRTVCIDPVAWNAPQLHLN